MDRFIKAAEENGLKVNIYAFCGDGHHDTNAHYRYFIEKQIAPIIPLSKATKAISPHLPDNDDLRLDYDGTPLCPTGVRMRHHMYDKNKKRHVFCCPAKRNTHRKSKTFYVFHKQECPRRQNCRPDSSLAPFVYIKSDSDPRLFPPIPRNSKLFKQLKNQRNASERINFINDSYNVEKSCRNADYGLIRLTLANIAHHAVLRYKARQNEKSDNGLGTWQEIMPPRLRRILVRIQGALRGAYSLSVPLNATQNTGQKTSKMGALFLATSLIPPDENPRLPGGI